MCPNHTWVDEGDVFGTSSCCAIPVAAQLTCGMLLRSGNIRGWSAVHDAHTRILPWKYQTFEGLVGSLMIRNAFVYDETSTRLFALDMCESLLAHAEFKNEPGFQKCLAGVVATLLDVEPSFKWYTDDLVERLG